MEQNFDLDFSTLENALSGGNPPTDTPPIEGNDDNNNQHVEAPPIASDNDDSSHDSDSPLHIFAKVLQEEGFFAEDDLKDYDGTVDSLVEKVAGYANKIAESKMSGYTPEAKKYIELLNNGVGEEEAANIVQAQKNLNDITEDVLNVDEDIQEEVVKAYLKSTGLGDDDIEDQIEYLKDQDKLKSKASNFLGKMKKRLEEEENLRVENAKAQKEEMKKNQEKTLTELKERVFSMKEFIPGMDMSDKMKEKIFQRITTPAKVENGMPISHVGLKRMKDPMQFEITLNILDELGVFDGKFDKLLNAGKKKSVEELTQSIQHSDFFNRSNPKSTPGDKAKEILSSIEGLPNMKI